MRKDIRCPKCGKMIAKMDEDGTVHVKSGRRMPQVIASGKVVLICPNEVLRPMEAPISCGAITEINGMEIFSHVSVAERHSVDSPRLGVP